MAEWENIRIERGREPEAALPPPRASLPPPEEPGGEEVARTGAAEERRTWQVTGPAVPLLVLLALLASFLLGFVTGRATEDRPAVVRTVPASPVPAPPAEVIEIDALALEGLWLFEFVEVADNCGRFPAAYTQQIPIEVRADETLVIPESLPGQVGPQATGAETVGSLAEGGIFSTELVRTVVDPAGERTLREVRYVGRFTTTAAAEGFYRLREGECRATYELDARRLT